MNTTTTQTNLFTTTLTATTLAFKVACAVRDQYDFWAPEYLKAQNLVDKFYAEMQALQGAVHWREWA